MQWAFEDTTLYRNMLACPDTYPHPDGKHLIGRWQISAIWEYYRRAGLAKNIALESAQGPYIWATGTQMGPDLWAGLPENGYRYQSLFDLIPDKVIDDAKKNLALIIIDSCNEGFTVPTLHEFWQSECARLGIPCRQLVYVTSNLSEEICYTAWADSNHVRDRITVISMAHWHYQYRIIAESSKQLSWSDHELRKMGNDRRIPVFSCLNNQWRRHREYMVLKLIQVGLHGKGAISHGPRFLDEWINYGIESDTIDIADQLLPMVVDQKHALKKQLANEFNPDIYINSWISLITETMAEDEQDCCFISEKIFKPVQGMQPFMVLGHRGTLQHLRNWGYETFENHLPESYDDLPYIQRVDALIRNLLWLNAQRDKWSWLESCREKCMHNHGILMSQDFFADPAHARIIDLYTVMEK